MIPPSKYPYCQAWYRYQQSPPPKFERVLLLINKPKSKALHAVIAFLDEIYTGDHSYDLVWQIFDDEAVASATCDHRDAVDDLWSQASPKPDDWWTPIPPPPVPKPRTKRSTK